jgi:hypothetical protein
MALSLRIVAVVDFAKAVATAIEGRYNRDASSHIVHRR